MEAEHHIHFSTQERASFQISLWNVTSDKFQIFIPIFLWL